ncbi:MAG: hypothetical protein K9N51_05230 [Candidatus Pacebacteria bacterium]|nr:hypothetical protein [Candidatus Paceibacterota bacterium]
MRTFSLKSFFVVSFLVIVVLAAANIWLRVRQSAKPPLKGPWTECVRIDDPSGNVYLKTTYLSKIGLGLKIAAADASRSAIIVVREGKSGVWVTPRAAFAPYATTSGHFYPERLPDRDDQEAELVLKFRPEAWVCYLNNRPVAVLPALFHPPATIHQISASVAAEGQDEPYVQKVADFTFHDDFLVPEGESNVLAGWDKHAGTWELHTAVDNAVERKNIAAKAGKKPEPARSPNFYSLYGNGEDARITTGYHFYDRYTVEAAVQTVPGEMGLIVLTQEDGACHGFTVTIPDKGTQALVRLWRRHKQADGAYDRRYLAAATTTLTPDQWVKLKVAVSEERIQAYVDRTQVFDVRAELPVGGPFGLFVSSETGVRFDDVAAGSNHLIRLDSIENVKRFLVREEGRLLDNRRGLLGLFRVQPQGDPSEIRITASREPRWMVLGAARHSPHVFAATFSPEDQDCSVGVLVGYRSADEPYLRYVRERAGDDELFLLERVAPAGSTVVEEFRRPFMPHEGGAIRLMADASRDGEVRLYCNGDMVLIHHPDAPVGGASGVYAGARTRATVRDLRYTFERDDLYRNKYEKNRIFVTDPFMRHWSSPEGAWITYPDGETWHKSDFFGGFLLRLPVINGSEVHLGVPEEVTTGDVILVIKETDLVLYDGKPGHDPDRDSEPLWQVPLGTLAAFDGDTQSESKEAGDRPSGRWYGVHYEGHWLWLTSGDQVIRKTSLDKPLGGSRIRIAGFTTEQLKHSYVERYSTKDFLFTESLHEWTINGGSWEVINRFQCQPRWSHMNGESKNSLAALWSKYRFEGDFCVEMYAGMRHGWYDRPGDLNMTVMNGDTTPSQGYTVTCTGWDPDHSQLWTKLYRNGTVVAKSDKYTVPRVRADRKRRGYNPLVHGGRDLHGAWYYMKVRRIGDRLEYWFDNELVLSTEDPEPLNGGSLGIWTFMNSMMVARVKIAAESIRPAKASFTPMASEVAALGLSALNTESPSPVNVQQNGHALGAMNPALWTAENPVGHAALEWHEDTDSGAYFSVTNVLGGGRMAASCELPPMPLKNLAGWTFRMKRTPRAQFNFHYQIGSLMGNGKFIPRQSVVHHISGTRFSEAGYTPGGDTSVRSVSARGAGWHTHGDWQRVRLYLSPDTIGMYDINDDVYVKAVGFGNLQPSLVLQGLAGNGPGEGYAVQDFSEIRYEPPQLQCSPADASVPRFQLIDPDSGRKLVADAGIAQVQNWLKALSDSGVHRVDLAVSHAGMTARHRLEWVNLPASLELSYGWSADIRDAIVIRNAANYPDPRFLQARITSNDRPLDVSADGVATRIARVPRRPLYASSSSPKVMFAVTTAGTREMFSLPWDEQPDRYPPVLFDVGDLSPFLGTFEQAEPPAGMSVDRNYVSFGRYDPRQGQYLRVANKGTQRRLRTHINTSFNLAKYPLWCMSYRTGIMGHVTMRASFGATAQVNLSEEENNAVSVRYGDEWNLDNGWHSWLGMISDAVGSLPFKKEGLICQSLQLGSFAQRDQTGLYSTLDVDDLALGPAVHTSGQLAFTPRFFDFNGVKTVAYVVRGGTAAYVQLSDAQRNTLAWHSAEPGQQITPDINGIPDGAAWLFLKASDTNGNESRVTSIPFLIDRLAPVGRHDFKSVRDPASNGTQLVIDFDTDGGAPLDVSTLVFKWHDEPVRLGPSSATLQHEARRDLLTVNWPLAFRRQLDTTEDGEVHQIVVANIQDGAGNRADDLVIPIVIDHGADKHPPTLLATKWPENVLYAANWQTDVGARTDVQAEHASVHVVNADGERGFLRMEGQHNRSVLTQRLRGTAWMLREFPYVAFRVRRPHVGNDKIEVFLELDCSHNTQFTIPLDQAADAKKYVTIEDPIKWAENTWHNVILNLYDRIVIHRVERLTEHLMASEKLSEKDARAKAREKAVEQLDKLRVRALRIVVHYKGARRPIDWQALSVFKGWGDSDALIVRGFDASGVAGTTVGGDREVALDTCTIVPAKLPPHDVGVPYWIHVKCRDKAGNLTSPMYVPVAPR